MAHTGKLAKVLWLSYLRVNRHSLGMLAVPFLFGPWEAPCVATLKKLMLGMRNTIPTPVVVAGKTTATLTSSAMVIV